MNMDNLDILGLNLRLIINIFKIFYFLNFPCINIFIKI